MKKTLLSFAAGASLACSYANARRQHLRDPNIFGLKTRGGGSNRLPHLTYSGTNDHEAYDERVLGGGEFVEHIWRETNSFNAVAAPPPSLDEIIERVAALFGIEATTLPRGSKQKTISDARAALCYVAIRMFGYRGIDLSKRLGLSEAGVVFAARRGEKLKVISEVMEIWSNTPADAARYNSDDNIHEILE